MTPNRIVALLAPVFASLSGLLAGLVADALPGAHLDKAELTAVFVAGALAAVTAVYQWLKGWQAHEARQELQAPVAKIAPTKVSRRAVSGE